MLKQNVAKLQNNRIYCNVRGVLVSILIRRIYVQCGIKYDVALIEHTNTHVHDMFDNKSVNIG